MEPDAETTRLMAAFVALTAWASPRALAFRDNRTPYSVLVAEFMLQQTQTGTMLPFFARFMAQWPTLEDLAAAAKDEVYLAFAGLGYYRRAGYLHDTAVRLVREHDATVPDDPATLLTLPGIGPYTANAIASIAFGRPVAAVDGNVVRVLARLLRKPYRRHSQSDLADVRTVMERAMSALQGRVHPGDINEALMDLSATVCKPKQPRCQACPIQTCCLAYRHGDVDRYPLKPEPKAKPVTAVDYLVLQRGDGVYVRKRTESLLKDTYEFVRLPDIDDFELSGADGKPAPIGTTTHVFSHRIWQVRFFRVVLPGLRPGECADEINVAGLTYRLVTRDDLPGLPFSSLFAEVIENLAFP